MKLKSLPLQSRHREKLTEMCNKLFPEFGEVQLLKSYIAKKTDDTGSPYLRWYVSRRKSIKLIEIHWYEFCMTYLLEKLYNPTPDIPNRSQKEEFCEFFWIANLFWWEGQPNTSAVLNTPHPVDYLYSKFKKFKL